MMGWRLRRGMIAAALVAAAVPVGLACDIPTYLYALENWPPDPYEVLVFHKGPLSGEALRALKRLRKASFKEGGTANIAVRAVDLSASPGQASLKVWKKRSPEARLPWVMALYPPSAGLPKVAWQGPLSPEAVGRLLDSPARRRVAERLLDGDAAVWVVVESGNSVKDRRFVSRLRRLLRKMEGEIVVHFLDPITGEDSTRRPNFSIVRVSRSDPAEGAFVKMLLHIEPGLEKVAEPVVFPVFGEGRAVCLLVGDEVDEDSVREVCTFVTEWCSCQVKAMNPGVDLLMAVDWEGGVERMQEEAFYGSSPGGTSQSAVASEGASPPSKTTEKAEPKATGTGNSTAVKTSKGRPSEKRKAPEQSKGARDEKEKPSAGPSAAPGRKPQEGQGSERVDEKKGGRTLDLAKLSEARTKVRPSPAPLPIEGEEAPSSLGRNLLLTGLALLLLVAATSGLVLLIRRRKE